MGVSFHDNEKGFRRLLEDFKLNDPAGVREFLRNYMKVMEKAAAGNYAAVIVLADFETAKERAGITEDEWAAIHDVLICGHSAADVAAITGESERSVYRKVKRATQRIADIYDYWALRGEGYDELLFGDARNQRDQSDAAR